MFGDCSFEKTLCNYTQACTDADANNWTVSDGNVSTSKQIFIF